MPKKDDDWRDNTSHIAFMKRNLVDLEKQVKESRDIKEIYELTKAKVTCERTLKTMEKAQKEYEKSKAKKDSKP